MIYSSNFFLNNFFSFYFCCSCLRNVHFENMANVNTFNSFDRWAFGKWFIFLLLLNMQANEKTHKRRYNAYLLLMAMDKTVYGNWYVVAVDIFAVAMEFMKWIAGGSKIIFFSISRRRCCCRCCTFIDVRTTRTTLATVANASTTFILNLPVLTTHIQIECCTTYGQMVVIFNCKLKDVTSMPRFWHCSKTTQKQNK